MPFQARLFPLFKPIKFFSGANKELHFHLFKLAHTENELTGYYFISESFTNLSDTKTYFHTSGLLNIQVVDKYSRGSFRTKIHFHSTIARRTHLCIKHQVKL